MTKNYSTNTEDVTSPVIDIRRTVMWLWLLTALFAFRTVAQLAQAFLDLPLLPPFSAWDSATLPYGFLLTTQVIILALMIGAATRLYRVRPAPDPKTGGCLLFAGACYFGVMLLRLVLGLTVMPDHAWVGRPIPAAFHLVLASFVLTLGLRGHAMREHR